MNYKKPSFIIILLFLFLLPVIVFSQEDNSSDIQIRKLESFLKILEQTYVEDVKEEKMVEDAINGILKELDPHSSYISKDEIDKMNEPLVGNFEGVGIQFNILNDTIIVVSPISGGPSEKVGILSGDKIIEIEGKNVAGIGITNQDVMDKLRGPKNTKVNISILRKGEKGLIAFTIVRDKIPLFSIDASYMIDDEIGYIKINRFSATTMDEFQKAMDILHSKGIKHLILDLRGNGGGYLNTAIDLADEFLGERKLIVFTKGRVFAKDEKYATSKGSFEKGKLVILMDEGSASASEIVAGAVQDLDRGVIIGRRSFGKGLVQKQYSLPDGSAVRVTVSKYYTPTGRCIQKPYDEGIDKYYDEIQIRFKHGELSNKDSINFPDSLLFYTPSKRIVYGGGGIMPDIFTPLDTSMISSYYKDLLRKGLINDFVLVYLDNNRDFITDKYKSFADFKNNFEVDDVLLNKFVDYAAKNDVKKDNKALNTSKKLITIYIKALIARDIWNSSSFYEISNRMNNTYQKAIEVLKDDTFQNMQLTY